MQNKKNYNICGVGNNIRSTKNQNAIQKKKIKSLKPGQKAFIGSMSSYEFGNGRLICHAKNLGQEYGFNIGPNGATDYSYILNKLGDQTQLFIRRNR